MTVSQRPETVAPAMLFDPFVVRCADYGVSMRLLTDASPNGPAVRCYLGAFDALIDSVALCAASDSLYQSVRLSDIPRELPVNADMQKPVVIHLGWRARNYRVLQRSDGRLVGLGWLQSARPAVPGVAIECDALLRIGGMFESAGLYAWREFNGILAGRSHVRLAGDALSAVNASDPDSRTNVRDYNQIAMFDPEAGEWHFIPRPGLLSLHG